MTAVILFLLWCTFLVPSLKIIASIFLEIFLIQYFIVLAELFRTSSLSSFAYYKNLNICKTKKRYSKKENTILLYFEKPFKWAAIIFYFIGNQRVHPQKFKSRQCYWLKGHVNLKLQVFLILCKHQQRKRIGIFFVHFSFVKEKNRFYEKKSPSGENNSYLLWHKWWNTNIVRQEFHMRILWWIGKVGVAWRIVNRRRAIQIWWISMIVTGLEKYFNSTLPIGLVTLNFSLPGTLPRLPKFSNSLIIHEP